MWRDMVIVVSMTLVFSFGVGVLFIHTLVELCGLLFGLSASAPPQRPHMEQAAVAATTSVPEDPVN